MDSDTETLAPSMENSGSLLLSSRSDVQPVDPSQVPEYVRETIVQQYFLIAILTILVYDAIITFDKEVKYFWKIPRKPVDFVYFANRYIGILGVSAFIICDFSVWMHVIGNWTTVILNDYILVIRVLALHSQNRKLSVCLYTLLALEAAIKVAIFIYLVILQHIAVAGLAKGVTACGQDVLVPWYWGLVDWIIPLVYGVVIMILAIYKAAEYLKLSAGFKGFILVKVLIKDQMLYFLAAIFCSLFAILSFSLQIRYLFLSDILSALGSSAFLCMLGSRMLFNLKEAGERGQYVGTNCKVTMRTVSDMEFGQTRPANIEVHELSEVVHEGGGPAGAV